MCDTKLGRTGLPRFRVDDDLGCYLDGLVDYPRPTFCGYPLCCVGAENQFHLLVNNPGSDAFARAGALNYAQRAPGSGVAGRNQFARDQGGFLSRITCMGGEDATSPTAARSRRLCAGEVRASGVQAGKLALPKASTEAG